MDSTKTYKMGNCICKILATGRDSAGGHNRAAVSTKYIGLPELNSEQKGRGCKEGSHIEEYIANVIVALGEIRKGRCLGAIEDCAVFESTLAQRQRKTDLIATAGHYCKTNTSVRHRAELAQRTRGKGFQHDNT